MASVDVKEIISKQGIDSVDKATAALEKGYLVLQDYIVGAKTLNDVLAKSKGMGDLSKNAEAGAIAQEKLRQAVLKTQQLEERLEQQRAKAAAAEEARQAKKNAIEQAQIAKDNARIARIQAIEATELRRAEQAAVIAQQEIANSSAVTGAQANEATAINTTAQARRQAARAAQQSALSVEQERQNNLANTQTLRTNAREQNAARGSLEQRQLALARLQRTYTQLNETERNSAFGQRLGRVIPQLNNQVLELERNIGRSQRNVGNYGNAFTRGLGNAFGFLRKIAYILPGVGLAGLIGFAVDPIVNYVSNLDLFKKKLSEIQIEQGNLNKTLEGGSYADAVKNVEELRINIDLAKKGFISKRDVVKQYNETIGQTTGQVSNLNQAETALNKNAEAYIQFTLLKAAAQLSLANAAQEAVKAAQQAQEDEERLKKQQTDYVIKGDKEGEAARKVLTKVLKSEIAQRGKDAEQAQQKQLTVAKKFQAEAAKIAKDNGFIGLITTKKDPKAKKGVDPAVQAAKDAQTRIDIEIDAAKKIADVYKSQADNENFSEETRLTSLQRYQEEVTHIASLEQDKQYSKYKATKADIEKADADFQAAIDNNNKETSQKTLAILQYTANEAEKLRLIQGQNTVTRLEQQRDEELTRLISAYEKEGDYSAEAQEKLEADRLEIIRKANLKIIDEQIQQAQKLIELRQAQGYDTTKQEAELTALILKGKETELEGIDKTNAKRLDKEKQNAEKLKEVAQGVFDFARTLTSQIFDTNIANLEQEKDIREKNKDLQLENIAESMLSEKEKADQTAIINAQAEQQQAAIDAKIAQQKRKQAIADKAFALAQIAINTAIAISAALKLPVLGAFVIPGIIALGAIQAATVLATPIPKFALGGTMKEDGLAEYGHGTELRRDPDGRVSLTSSTPEIGFVKKGTKFISAPETKRLMGKPDRYDTGGNSWDISGLIAESQLTRKEFKKAISKIAVRSTSITEKGFNHQTGRMANINKYISRNFSRN